MCKSHFNDTVSLAILYYLRVKDKTSRICNQKESRSTQFMQFRKTHVDFSCSGSLRKAQHSILISIFPQVKKKGNHSSKNWMSVQTEHFYQGRIHHFTSSHLKRKQIKPITGYSSTDFLLKFWMVNAKYVHVVNAQF